MNYYCMVIVLDWKRCISVEAKVYFRAGVSKLFAKIW